jgi:TolB-like protein/DNA-binding winged helix-turn-helix (wHTH) protein
MSTPLDSSPTCYAIDDLTVDFANRSVDRGGERIALNTLSFELLRTLVTAAPETVTYDDLAEKAWGRRFVSQEAIAQRVKLLRQALSEDGTNPRYIESVRGKGYRLKVVPQVVSTQAVDKRRTWYTWPLLGTGVALVTIFAGFLLTTRSTVMPDSVAVLPFEDMSSASADAYCAKAMHSEINYELTRLGLNVISRDSVSRYSENRPSLRTIGEALNVKSLLDGTIRCDSNEVHLVLELVDPATGANLWAMEYDTSLDEVERMQAAIATQVADVLNPLLSARATRNIAATQPNPVAAAASARAMEAYSAQRLPEGIEHLTRAIELDASFARAYAYRAVLRAVTLFNTYFAVADSSRTNEETAKLAIADAERALQLDGELGIAHVARGIVDAAFWRWTEARASFELGLGASPNDADVALFYTVFMRDIGGDRAKVTETARRAVALNPHSYVAHVYLAGALEYAGDIQGSLDAEREAAYMAPTHEGVLLDLAVRELVFGDSGAAVRALRLADEFAADNDIARAQGHRRAYAYALLGSEEEALRNLRGFDDWRSTSGTRIGLGDEAFVHLARRDFESALRVLLLAADKAENGIFDEGFWRLRDLRINRFGDPVLAERREFVEVRARLVGR